MTTYKVSVPVIACDTRDEMGTIIQAVKNGTLVETLGQFAKVKDKFGEPACVYTPLDPVVFEDSEHIGQIRDHNKPIDMWVSHVGNRIAEFYILWGEEVKEDPA